MDTSEMEDNGKAQENNGNGTRTPSILDETSVTPNDGRLSTEPNGTPEGHCDGGAVGGGGVGDENEDGGGGGDVAGCSGGRRSDGNFGTDAGSSAIPNTNNIEAHRHIVAGESIASGSRDQDDLDIKQELLENYFHAHHPPDSPDSHRSYSPNDDSHDGNEWPDEFAQDVRVSAAAAAVKSIDFTRYYNSLMSGPCRSVSPIGNPNGGNGIPERGPSTPAAVCAETLTKDEYDHVGSNASIKLRTMDPTQRIIAEKLIGDVLYYGQFNELKRGSRLQFK